MTPLMPGWEEVDGGAEHGMYYYNRSGQGLGLGLGARNRISQPGRRRCYYNSASGGDRLRAPIDGHTKEVGKPSSRRACKRRSPRIAVRATHPSPSLALTLALALTLTLTLTNLTLTLTLTLT